MTIKPTQ